MAVPSNECVITDLQLQVAKLETEVRTGWDVNAMLRQQLHEARDELAWVQLCYASLRRYIKRLTRALRFLNQN